mgnify:FL=1
MRLIIGPLLALAFLLPLSSDAARTHPRLLDSVRPLSQIVFRDFEADLIAYRNICTVSSINAATHLWLTAAHCVLVETMDEDGIITTSPRLGLVIEGRLVFIVKTDAVADLAILFTPDLSAPALRLADKGPFWEDTVRVVGHPFGYPSVTIAAGTVANPDAVLDSEPGFAPSYLLITAMVAPGNSGSPIVNTHGEMFSVLQIVWGGGYSPGGGATYARLKALVGSYFER